MDKDLRYEPLEELFNYCKDAGTQIGTRVHDWLNEDNLYGVVVDNRDIFWFETHSYVSMPNYVHAYIIRYFEKKKSYRYLYNVIN